MPVVTVNVPEPKADPLLRELLQEFRSVANVLRGLKVPKDDASSKALAMVSRQQDALLRSIERMLGMMSQMSKHQNNKPPMGDMMKGMKSSLSGFASDLKDAVKASYRKSNGSPRPHVTVKPNITVSMNGLAKRFDRLEQVMANNSSRSRNRTFGSNY